MTKTYVIADLHGRYDLLELGMRTIVHDTSFFHSGDSIVTLGDYVDRGPQSRQIIEYLMAMQRDLGSRLICLKGNHEDIMWQTCRKLRAQREAARFAALRIFHFDDLGTEPGERLGTGWAGLELRQVKNTDAGKKGRKSTVCSHFLVPPVRSVQRHCHAYGICIQIRPFRSRGAVAFSIT